MSSRATAALAATRAAMARRLAVTTAAPMPMAPTSSVPSTRPPSWNEVDDEREGDEA